MRTAGWALLRAVFYVYFSLVSGAFAMAAYAIVFDLQGFGGLRALPAGIAAGFVVLLVLSMTHLDHFGRSISLLRWIPLCVVGTLVTVAAVSVATSPS